jgi:hypothetical protein
MANSSSTVFLNPNTYLNYLSPKEATEYEATRNILLVILGVSSFLHMFFPCSTLQKASIWDLLASIPDDLQVLRRSRFRSTTFCFIFSRSVCTAAYLLVSNSIRRCFTIAALVICNIIRRSTYPLC